MKSLYSYLITMLAVLFWIFRVMACLMYSLKRDFICTPLNFSVEIIILFLTIPSILFIIRRNVIAATLYFGMYAAYFGTVLYNSIAGSSATGLTIMSSTSILFAAVGVVLPFLIFCDILIQKSHLVPKDKETDWYYGNEKYERQYDERADRNQYKIR